MDNLSVQSLAGISAETLGAASNEAFRDYPVSVQMTAGQLTTMMCQNDVDLRASAGLFDSGNLVGFWLNGVRTLDGIEVGYDSGTAICKPYRGRGLSKRLAALSDALMIERGVREYFLEVLTQNETAYRIYLKSGFRVTRRLLCLKTDTPPDTDERLPAGLEMQEGPLDACVAEQLPAMEYRPSWQHTTRSMLNIKNGVHTVVVRDGGQVVGYGAIMPERSRITQIAVAGRLRSGGVPSLILRQLGRAGNESEIMVNNVDPSAEWTLDLLRRHGFTQYVDQYEMTRSLIPSAEEAGDAPTQS